MDIVNIYGYLDNNAEIVIGIGNYNNIHGLLTYFPFDKLLHMRQLADIIAPSIVELTLVYEPDDKKYFSLKIKDTEKYIGVNIESQDNINVAVSIITDIKTLFWIDYSSVDNLPRSDILSGVLYSLKTSFGEQEYSVSWEIQGFSNGNLIMFIPTTWYEKDGVCKENKGTLTLIERLNQLSFKGYASQSWCQESEYITNCTHTQGCGKCMGKCTDPKHICHAVGDNKYLCGPVNSDVVTFVETQPQGNTAAWIVVVSIIVIVALLTWGRTRNNQVFLY